MSRSLLYKHASTVLLILLMALLALVNHALLEHRAELWKEFSGVETRIPSRNTLYQWDVIRYAFGVVLMPAAAAVWWFANWKTPFREWTVATLVTFLIGAASMYLHLSLMYGWIRESHLALPSGVTRGIVLLSLNAPIYLSAISLAVVIRWIRRPGRPPAFERP